jgi:hypothetical protein
MPCTTVAGGCEAGDRSAAALPPGAGAMNPANIESILATIMDLASSPEEKVRLEYRTAPAAGWDVKVISGNPDALDRAEKILRDSAVVDSLRIKGANAFIGFNDRYVEGQAPRPSRSRAHFAVSGQSCSSSIPTPPRRCISGTCTKRFSATRWPRCWRAWEPR